MMATASRFAELGSISETGVYDSEICFRNKTQDALNKVILDIPEKININNVSKDIELGLGAKIRKDSEHMLILIEGFNFRLFKLKLWSIFQ